MNAFPIHASKVQRPPLRDQTLARDRLLDWLSAKIHHRLVLVTAEAGYGKTTLLADFSGRTRLPTLWYRLDEGDRDWVTILNYLVAAGRELDPDFAPTTWSMLGELGTSGSSKDAVLASFLRELQPLGERGAVWVFDDYHAVEDVPDVEQIVREIVVRAPERLSIVILTRRQPALPIARLRALGEVAELTRDELRFDADETERLFRETYGRPLESDVLEELTRHTEGWAASLQLVQSALRERTSTETRTFIRALSGAQGTLHDYLAEEVVGDLDPSLQAFLMRTSILTTLDATTGSVVASVPEDEARRHLESAERIGLLPRSGRSSNAYHYHKLVRDFLQDRLRREIGDTGIADLHRRMARFGETTDWKLAVHHYAGAGDIDDLRRVLVGSIQDIMGSGGFALAESYVNRHPELEPDPSFGLFLSRRDLYRGDFAKARARAQAAVDAYPSDRTSRESQLALANLSSIEGLTGDVQTSLMLARRLEEANPTDELALLAKGLIFIATQSVDGSFEEGRRLLGEILTAQRVRGHEHYQGITHLNLAESCRALGLAHESLRHADQAIALLSESSAGSELPSVFMLRAWALHHIGQPFAANEAIAAAIRDAGPSRACALVESADVDARYGDPVVALKHLEEGAALGLLPIEDDLRRLVQADLQSRLSEDQRAVALLSGLHDTIARSTPAFVGRSWLVASQVELRAGRNPNEQMHAAHRVFSSQRAHYWIRCLALVRAVATLPSEKLSAAILGATQDQPVFTTVCADDLAIRLGEFEADLRALLSDQARLRPTRWRPVLRRTIQQGDKASILAAAEMLDEVGERDDVPQLRTLARLHRGLARPSLGRSLARRLAPRAHVNDLGHVSVQIGDRVVDGSSVRRKVLTLMCFLLTRPGFTAARDQVLEALWPDLDPSVAVNSLNQTVYFLRRIFEPSYVEDQSANYVNHDGELVRLDPQLVSSQSTKCQTLLEAARRTLDPATVDRINQAYVGRFAVDFEYDDWASPFRETLHASYLDVIEQAIRVDINMGMFDRAALVAQKAIQIDPEAAELEAVLLHLYRRTGSHAAAAEQYSHYAASLRADGFEPPSLDSL